MNSIKQNLCKIISRISVLVIMLEILSNNTALITLAANNENTISYQLLEDKINTINNTFTAIDTAEFNTLDETIASHTEALKLLINDTQEPVEKLRNVYSGSFNASTTNSIAITSTVSSLTPISAALKSKIINLNTSLDRLNTYLPKLQNTTWRIKSAGAYIQLICDHIDWFSNPANLNSINNSSQLWRTESIKSLIKYADDLLQSPLNTALLDITKSLETQINYTFEYKTTEIVKRWTKNSNYNPINTSLNNEEVLTNNWNSWEGENDPAYNIDISKYNPNGLFLSFDYIVDISGADMNAPENQAVKAALPNAFKSKGIFFRVDATERHDWHSEFYFGDTGAVSVGINKIIIPLGEYISGAGSNTKPNDGLVPVLSNGKYMESLSNFNEKKLSPRSEKTFGRIAFLYNNTSGIQNVPGAERFSVNIDIENLTLCYDESLIPNKNTISELHLQDKHGALIALKNKLTTANTIIPATNKKRFESLNTAITTDIATIKQLISDTQILINEFYDSRQSATYLNAANYKPLFVSIGNDIKTKRDSLNTASIKLYASMPELKNIMLQIRSANVYITDLCDKLDKFDSINGSSSGAKSIYIDNIRSLIQHAESELQSPKDIIIKGSIDTIKTQLNYISEYKTKEVLKQWQKNYNNYKPISIPLNSEQVVQNDWNSWHGENYSPSNIDVSKYDPEGLYLTFDYIVQLTGADINAPENHMVKAALPKAFKSPGIFLRVDATARHDWHSEFNFGATGAISVGTNKIVIPLGEYLSSAGSVTKPNNGLVPIISNGKYMGTLSNFNEKSLSPRSEKTFGRIAFIYNNTSGMKNVPGADRFTVNINIENLALCYDGSKTFGINSTNTGSTELTPQQKNISLVNGSEYHIPISAYLLKNSNTKIHTVTYPAEIFDIVNLAGMTEHTAITTGKYGNIEITSVSDGKIEFVVDNDVDVGYTFSGIVNIISLRAKVTGIYTISVDTR